MGLPKLRSLYLPLIANHRKRSKFTEYFPAQIVNKEGQTFLKTNTYQTSGDIAAMIGSDGLALHPAEATEVTQNMVIEFLPW